MDGRTRRALPGIIKKIEAMASKETDEDVRQDLTDAAEVLRGVYEIEGGKPQQTYLARANLAGANLAGAKLIGERPVFQVGPIGSRCDYLVSYLTDVGVKIRAGCFFGSLDEFVSAVKETHRDNEHAREYMAAVSLIQAHAAMWTPVLEEKAA